LIDGVINILKPENMTSHDLVNIVRKALKTRAVGHTGTLDPNATGVMNILVGRYTKLLPYIDAPKKEYIAGLSFGYSSDTLDIWGNVIEHDKIELNRLKLISVLNNFLGVQDQVPPMYSAIKINGKKLYEYAREGIEVVREPRKINIHEIELIKLKEDEAIIRVVCSKGTYIRSLIDDIGKSYGTFAIMNSLIRTENENINKNNCINIDTLKDQGSKLLLNPAILLPNNGVVEIDERTYKMVKNGIKCKLNDFIKRESDNDFYNIVYNNDFCGIAQTNNGIIEFSKMF
jgi:tRNA pseudouridine55 synthase